MSFRRCGTKFSLCACIVVIALAGTISRGSPLQAIQPFAASCSADDEIPAKDRAAVDQAAVEFTHNALGPNPESAYLAFTAETKAGLSLEQFKTAVNQSIQPMGPFSELRAARTYLATVIGGTQPQQVVCGNLSSPQSWVAVTTKPGPAQAHVIVEAQTHNNTWAFVLWILKEEGTWRVQYFQSTLATIVDKTSEDLRQMALTQKQRNHNFNAYIFYATAMQLSKRGPYLQLGIQPEIQQELAALQTPRELQGPAPFIWRFGEASFNVLTVGPVGVDKKIYLKIDSELEPWANDKDADDQNHELISAFAKAYPEYKDAFSGLVVRAHERGGPRRFGTVVENELTGK
jgi:hypothetical protein